MLKTRIEGNEIIFPESLGKSEADTLIIKDLIIIHRGKTKLEPIRGLTKGLIEDSVKAVRDVREEWK